MSNENGAEPIGRRAVAVLALETGGCGACAQSIAALHAAGYAEELAARKITFVRSPRQADVVLVSGPLSTTAESAVRRILDQVPEPQALVAAGNCAINGCVFAGSPQISASVSEALDVHIELPGCPPTPTAILNAISKAAQLLAEGDDGDDVADETGGSTAEASAEPAEGDADDTADDDNIDDSEDDEIDDTGESEDEPDEAETAAGGDEPEARMEGEK
jgi:Ni,Fe-hydrogenase III small subunit